MGESDRTCAGIRAPNRLAKRPAQYNRTMGNLLESARRQRAPATITLIGLWVVCSLALWLSQMRGIEWIAFPSSGWLAQPWSLLTYPFAFMQWSSAFGILFFLFLVLWFFMAGGNVEREVGTGRFVTFFVASTVLGGLALWAGSGIRPVVEGGPTLPVSAVTVVWCLRNMGSVIRLYGVIPVSGKILAILTAVIIFFVYGFGAPVLGLLALIPLAFGWAFATNRMPFFRYSYPVAAPQKSKAQIERERKYFDDVRKREAERLEKERLRDLFERSGVKDEPDL